MSTSSDALALERQIAQLLAAVAHECSRLGTEISHLGAAASGAAGRKGASFNVVRMQSFDRLAQNAHAQSSLIAHIAQIVMSAQSHRPCVLADAINNNPLSDVRARLKEAIGFDSIEISMPDEEVWDAEPLTVEANSR